MDEFDSKARQQARWIMESAAMAAANGRTLILYVFI